MPTSSEDPLGTTSSRSPTVSRRSSYSRMENAASPSCSVFGLGALSFHQTSTTTSTTAQQPPTPAGSPVLIEKGFKYANSTPTKSSSGKTSTIITPPGSFDSTNSVETESQVSVQRTASRLRPTTASIRMRARSSKAGRNSTGSSSALDKIKNRSLKPGVEVDSIHYPSHWSRLSPEFQQKLVDEWRINASDGPENYARTIPFKAMMNTFGRSGFDLYEYRFEAMTSGENPVWDKFWVMWDYHNGLVRIHDMFACCRPGKTEPGKAVNLNIFDEESKIGLPQIVQPVTGGNLEAQGYWIPFNAARALLAKFCYPIREPLAIMFGPEFVDECVQPEEEGYGNYRIDDNIIRECQRLHEKNRALEFARNSIPLTVKTTSICTASTRPSRKSKRPAENLPPSPPLSKDSSESPSDVRPAESWTDAYISPVHQGSPDASEPSEDAITIYWDPIRDCTEAQSLNEQSLHATMTETSFAKSSTHRATNTEGHKSDYRPIEPRPSPYHIPPEDSLTDSFPRFDFGYQLSRTNIPIEMVAQRAANKRKRANPASQPGPVSKKTKASAKLVGSSKVPGKKGQSATSVSKSSTHKSPVHSTVQSSKSSNSRSSIAGPVTDDAKVDDDVLEVSDNASDNTMIDDQGDVQNFGSDDEYTDTEEALNSNPCRCGCGRQNCASVPTLPPLVPLQSHIFEDITFNNRSSNDCYYNFGSRSREAVSDRWSYERMASSDLSLEPYRQTAGYHMDQMNTAKMSMIPEENDEEVENMDLTEDVIWAAHILMDMRNSRTYVEFVEGN